MKTLAHLLELKRRKDEFCESFNDSMDKLCHLAEEVKELAIHTFENISELDGLQERVANLEGPKKPEEGTVAEGVDA